MTLPDIVDRGLADSLRGGHQSTTPMRHAFGLVAQRRVHHRVDLFRAVGRLATRPGATSHNPSKLSCAKRACHNITVLRLVSSRAAISSADFPSAAARTTRHRNATCCGVPKAETH